MKHGIGQSVLRFEDRRFVSGGGQYTDDFAAAGAAIAYFLRSPHAHARIASIEVDEAIKMPGINGVFTGADIAAAGLGNLPCPVLDSVSLKRADGSPVFHPPRPAIARDRVRHVGDIVAMVVADSLSAAKDAAEAIKVEFEELSAVTTPADAIKSGAPNVWDECPGNVAYVCKIGDKGAVERAFEVAAHTVRFDWRNQRVAPSPLEPRAAVGSYDRSEGRFKLIAGVQNPHDIRRQLAQNVFGLPELMFQIISPDLGGAFGSRGNCFPEIVLVLWAARQTGRPVKWTGERTEAFVSDDQGRDSHHSVELALDNDGIFLALRVQSITTVGAYFSSAGPLPSFNNVGGLAGVYRTPAIYTEVVGTLTNTPTIAPYRGAGRPEASFSIEMAIDLAARKLGFDRIALRRINMIPRISMQPYRTGLTFVYDSGDFEAILDAALTLSDVQGFSERKRAASERGMLRGLGISCVIEQSAGGLDEACQLRVDQTGDAILSIGTHNHGQGHSTIFRQILSDQLHLPLDRISISRCDTDLIAHGHGTFGSRSAALGAAVIERAAMRVIDRAKEIAAYRLDTICEQVRFEAGQFVALNTNRSVSWNDVARFAYSPKFLPPGFETGLWATASYTPSGPSFPNSCHICEIEIDRETGSLRLDRYAVVDDVGRVVNPALVEGQIHGGVVQGMGQVLFEKLVFDDTSGQVITGSLMDYCLPRADNVPFINVQSHPVPTSINPLGIKGAGEAGAVGALPCVQSAILDALAPFGLDLFKMPASSENLWRTMNERKSAANRG